MVWDETARKAAIIDEVGDPSGTLATKITSQWEKYAAYEAASPALRDLYVKRGLIQIEYARLRADVDFTVDGLTSVKASQAAAALLKLLDVVNAEIVVATGDELGASGAAIGTLTAVTPETPPSAPLVRPYGPDSTDPQYQGNPYYPRRRVAW